jgi:pimeloyl-ACP methyl ester carboxylesterase
VSTHSVNINGIDLVYDKEGSGPPLVFLPGGNASTVYWEAVVPHFMADYTCFTLDQRGHGRSGRPTPPSYAIDAFISDCKQFMDAVTGPAILVGWSLGGLVSFGVAAERPELVRAIYAEDAIPQSATPGVDTLPVVTFLRQLGHLARLRESEHLSIAQHAYNIGQLTTGGIKNIDLWPPATLVFFSRFTEGTDPAFYDSLEGQNWTDDEADALCRNIRCPVHLAVGDNAVGGVVSAKALEALSATGMPFTMTNFPGAPHAVSRAFPREFINDLKAFLGRLPT